MFDMTDTWIWQMHGTIFVIIIAYRNIHFHYQPLQCIIQKAHKESIRIRCIYPHDFTSYGKKNEEWCCSTPTRYVVLQLFISKRASTGYCLFVHMIWFTGKSFFTHLNFYHDTQIDTIFIWYIKLLTSLASPCTEETINYPYIYNGTNYKYSAQ